MGYENTAGVYAERPYEETQSDTYRALLNQPQVNLAIYLGKSSNGLCSVDFDLDADLAAFLALNPKLVMTTRSRGSRGGMVWVRIDGEYPASCNPNHKHFEFRADKRLSTIFGRHPQGMDYTLAVDAPPVTLAFAEIVWPAGWELPWVGSTEREAEAALIKEFGQPYYIGDFGGVSGNFNERYWAALYSRENRVVERIRTIKLLSLRGGHRACGNQVTLEAIRENISARILVKSAVRPGCSTLEIKITQARLNAIVSGARKGIVAQRGRVPLVSKNFTHAANGVIRFY